MGILDVFYTNVVATCIASDSGGIISANTRQRLVSCEVSMARKLRRKDSGFFILLLLVVLSFAIANWFGIDLYAVIIAIVSVAILVMLGSIAKKQVRRSQSVAKGKTVLPSKQKRGIVLGLMGVGILALLALIATPIINWFSQNLHTIITIVLLLAAFAVATTFVWTNRRQIKRWRVFKGNGGGTRLEKYTWFPASAKDEQILRVKNWILSFNPKKDYELEADYHNELFHWLKHKDPQTISKQQRGSAIPDIVIGDVAIEVKGPTENRDLGTIPDKSWRYLGEDDPYSFLFIVLFKPRFTDDHFHVILRQLKYQYPSRSAVITKK